MAAITPPSITPVPTPVPQRNDRVTFSDRVDAFVTWLINAVTEFGAVASNVYANASDAFSSASSASTSASTASTQASTAVTSASTAVTSASTASTQASLAVTSASNAEASRLYVDKLYLGSKSTDPTVDNQGSTLQQGANYYNSTSHKIRAYTGSAWVDGISSVAGVITVNGLSGAVTVQDTLISGSNIKTVNGNSLLGSGNITVSPSITWVTKTSGSYTAVSGDSIRADTSGGVLTITLPVSPSDNDVVRFKDYSGTFSNNKLTFRSNGKNIMGLAQDMDVTENNRTGELTFISATNDWRF